MIVITNYNIEPSWVKEYTDDYFIFDRSDSDEYMKNFPKEKYSRVENIGGDNYDKLKFIIDNYDNLPKSTQFLRGNLFKYISKEEYDVICRNESFTPVLTMHHKTQDGVCYYKDGIYWEINDRWFVLCLPFKNLQVVDEMYNVLGIKNMDYLPFAPGCNYILPRENILRYSKEFYIKLLKYIEWHKWPGEAAILERAFYTLWK